VLLRCWRERDVALKVLKPGMDTRQVVARFEAERQALALMDHPRIARVFDAGTTASGRPYFVMELVRGVPITDFCDQRRLTTRQRLELFATVCQAVQHAHQKGIIHRDLKPSNVLVTLHDTLAVPKVIDFGIAKATTRPWPTTANSTNWSGRPRISATRSVSRCARTWRCRSWVSSTIGWRRSVRRCCPRARWRRRWGTR
jgi:serine/threonine protein kinase